MWWLAIPVAVGAVAAIWNLFDNDAKAARERWAYEHANLQQTVEEHRRNIERNLAKAQQSYDFHFLCNLHFSSMKIADHAYKLLKDARISLDTMGRMLVEAKQRRDELFEQKRKATTNNEKYQFQQEINLLNELRSNIFPDKDALKVQRDEMNDEVRRLNEQTRLLKLAIRDRCGTKGRDWYERLESRTSSRRRNRYEW